MTAAVLGLTEGAAAQLVVEGETIADAALLDAAKKEGKLLLYSVYTNEPMQVIVGAFQRDTGIKVEVVRLPGAQMFQRVTSEFAANRLDADYMDVTDLGWIAQLIDRRILNVAHKVPAFAQIPETTRDPEGRWYSFVRVAEVVGINTSRVKEADAPKSWKDLLDPKWKGLVGTPDIHAGGSMWTMYSFLRERVDPDFWKKFAAQSPKFYPSIAPAAVDLARGEVPIVAGPLAEPALTQAKAGAPLKVIFPTEGVASFPAAGGITATAKNPNAAKLWLNWTMSRHGGNIIARQGGYPANAQSERPRFEGVEFPSQDKVWNLKIDAWTAGRDAGVKEWREIFGVK
jgi:iron(III) transport system substrate-binding protein